MELRGAESGLKLGKGSIGATVLLPTAKYILHGGIDTPDRVWGLEINDAGQRVQMRAGRGLFGNKLMLVLSPTVTYGAKKGQPIKWEAWLPPSKPPALVGLPRCVLNSSFSMFAIMMTALALLVEFELKRTRRCGNL